MVPRGPKVQEAVQVQSPGRPGKMCQIKHAGTMQLQQEQIHTVDCVVEVGKVETGENEGKGKMQQMETGPQQGGNRDACARNRSNVLRTTAAGIVEHEEAPLVRVDDLQQSGT